jgi:hypothetical protein
VDRLAGRHVLLAQYVQGNAAGTRVTGVAVSGETVVWGSQGGGEQETAATALLYTRPLGGGRTTMRRAPFALRSSAGYPAARSAVLRCPGPLAAAAPAGARTCEVLRLGP